MLRLHKEWSGAERWNRATSAQLLHFAGQMPNY